MGLGPFSHFHLPSGGAPVRWFIFRIREQMYGMCLSANQGFSFSAIQEDREALFDDCCQSDAHPQFTYIRLDPHPTDDALGNMARPKRLAPQRLTDYERAFLAKHCPEVLEELKRTTL